MSSKDLLDQLEMPETMEQQDPGNLGPKKKFKYKKKGKAPNDTAVVRPK